ncbi:transglycosylase SLT domain-containing protein, partial [Mesorhizobium sp. B2-6-7]
IVLSKRIGCDPSHLMAAMAFESGETFAPDKRNPSSGATGLIQFMRSTAEGLGTSLEALAQMSQVQQLVYVEKYLAPYAGRFGSLSDMYMAILYPAAIGKPEASVLFSSGTKAYSQNSGLDVNGDGFVTKGEAASKVQAELDKGLTAGLVG